MVDMAEKDFSDDGNSGVDTRVGIIMDFTLRTFKVNFLQLVTRLSDTVRWFFKSFKNFNFFIFSIFPFFF